MNPIGIVIHGGAGTILKSRMTPEKESGYRQGLEVAVQLGYDRLASGASALDAVEATVIALENNPLFNAGKGAVFAGDGTQLFDAAIMCGKSLKAGALAGVRGVKNPIHLARTILEQSPYVLMIGAGAEEFARQYGLEFAPPEYFFDTLRYQQWQSVRGTPITQLDHSDKGEKNFSTVGAVAVDQQGNLAAASSTGGMTNKRFGRVGDTPLIGSGTYAHNDSCAVGCTGHGEMFIRSVVAHDVVARMRYLGQSLQEAAKAVIFEGLPKVQGTGGLIAIDRQANVALPFNTAGMYRAAKTSRMELTTGIFG
ncbi:MAG: isoaspartyl peptidase/L-asparaginase [Bacteroidota bacterium]